MKVKTKLCAAVLAMALGCGVIAGCNSNNGGKPSGGGNPSSSQQDQTKYLVNVPAGDYTVTGIEAEGYLAGAKVTFTVTPASGKEIVSVGYDNVNLTAKADGSYEFNMPEKNVTLNVSVRAIAQYSLTYTGTLQVDADPVTFSLKLGTNPVPGAVLEEAEGADLVDIDGFEVTAKAAGQTTIIAKLNGQEVARLEVTVLASELMSVKAALDAAIIEAPCNGSAGNNSKKTESNYTIAGQVIAMSNYDDSGAMSVVIDDGTAAALLVVYSSSKTAPEWAVGDSVKTTCKFTNYYGLLEGISTSSTATKQNSLYPDQIVKVEKTFTPSLAQATAMTGAQYLEYVALATANQSATAGKWTPLKRVSIAVTYDKDHDMGGGNSGGYVIDGATEYAIHAAELSRITLDAGNGHKSTLSGILTGVNSTRKTSKIFADTQTPLAVSSITFADGDSKTIFLNNPVELEYTLAPEGSYGQETWTSSNPAKVSVDKGVITGLEQGESTITLVINGVSKSINIVVSGEQHVCEGISLNKDSLTLVKGSNETLEATVLPSNCTDAITWTSNTPSIATVDNDGKVTAVAVGSAVITVTCGNFSDTCTVSVREQKLSDLAHAKVGDAVDAYAYYVDKYPQDVSGMWIADGDAGAYLHRKPTGLTKGDIVHVVGTVAANHGAKQISATTCEKVESYTGLTAPTTLNLDEAALAAIDETYQGRYASVTGTVTSNSVSSSGHRTVKVSVGEESFTVYVHKTNCGEDAVNDFERAAVGRQITAKGYISANKSNETDFTKVTKSQYQFLNPTLEDVQIPQATGIILDKTTAEVEQGKTLQLTVSSEPAGAALPGTVSWTVEGNNKVTVDQTGLVSVAADASTSETATVKAAVSTFEATCVITVKEAGAYNVTKATSIAVGDSLIMSAEASDGSYAKQFNGIITAGSNKIGEAVDYTGSTPDVSKARITVVAGSKDNTFALKVGDKYITWKSGNTLDEQASVDDNASWTITITDGVVTVTNVKDATRKLQYNSGSPRFAAYTSAQKPVTFWKVTANS